MAKAKCKGRKGRKINKIKREDKITVPEHKNDSGRNSHMEHNFEGTIKDPDGNWTVHGKMMWD